jgi:hypothetical protein
VEKISAKQQNTSNNALTFDGGAQGMIPKVETGFGGDHANKEEPE